MEQTETQPYNIYENPILFRVFSSPLPEESPQKFLLLHGWTGNEGSMSVFLNALPNKYTAISPRGLFHISTDSYGWLDITAHPKPSFIDFVELADLLFEKLRTISKNLNLNQQDKWNVIGFSQGAALASVLAVRHPNYFQKICLLSGFLPNSPPQIEPALSNLEVFISHGIHDHMVPFDQALITKNYFTQAGASVTFCEEEQNHKIGAACSINLKKFLNS